jgi:hypothetical protein
MRLKIFESAWYSSTKTRMHWHSERFSDEAGGIRLCRVEIGP